MPLVAGYGLVLAATLPITVRRVWPLPAFAVVLAADGAAVLLQLVPIPTPMVAVVGYTVAVHASRRVAVGALVVALAADVVLAVALPGLPGSGIAGGATVPFATLTLAAWCLGIAAKSQREYQNARLADEADRVAAEERLRIAREQHEWHGTNAFIRDGDRVFRTIYGRGVEALGTVWSYLDMTALGRQEEWEDSPAGYPQTPLYAWWNWHDAYGTPPRRRRNCWPRYSEQSTASTAAALRG